MLYEVITALGALVLVILVIIALVKMPKKTEHAESLDLNATFQVLLKNKRYYEGRNNFV